MQSKFHSPEYAHKKRQKILRLTYIVGAIILTPIIALSLLTHWSKIQINAITVTGTQLLSSNDIQMAAEKIISGNDFFIFARNNALFYPRKNLESSLPEQFPRIQTIEVDLFNWHTIHIALSERIPVGLWCGSAPLSSDSASSTTTSQVTPCYFLDNTGFVFAPAPDFSGDAYFKYYGLLPYASAVGESYLNSADAFGQVNNFVNAVKALNITPLYIVADDPNDFEMHIYGGGVILFDDSDLVGEADHLQKLLQTNNLIPKQGGELDVQSIDLRYGDKVYYKVKGQNP